MLTNKFLRRLPFHESDGSWSNSTATTGEYYTDEVIVKPLNVVADGVNLTEGTLGSLANDEWAYGDQDTLGYNTIYMNTGVDPDTVVCKWSEPILLSSINGSDIMCLSIMINNCESTAANIVLIISDGFSVAKTISLETIDDDYTFDGFVLNSLDRVEILSNKENVNALMSVSYTEE